MLWYSLEAPQQGTSNEYPQYMFSWRNKKNVYTVCSGRLSQYLGLLPYIWAMQKGDEGPEQTEKSDYNLCSALTAV